MVQDGDAHKRVHWCKGDAGMKLCMLCRNLHTEKSAVVGEDGTNLLTCSLIHEADLDFATADDIRGSARRLAGWRGHESAGDFRLREQAYGFTHNPHSILLDPSLDAIYDPEANFMHDWMHGMIVHGVFNIIAYLLLESFRDDGRQSIGHDFFNYIGGWFWPSRISATGHADIFSPSRLKASRKAKF